MKILICDDDKRTLNYLEEIISGHYNETHHIYTISSATELLEFKENVDLLLCDIKLDNENGIDACKRFIQVHPCVKIVFITGYPTEYFQDIFNHFRPYGFIGKPICEDFLFSKIDNIEKILQSNDKIEFIRNGVSLKLNPNGIVFIESHGRQKFVITERETYIVNLSFEEIDNMMPEYFTRCHNAFIVNVNYISSYKNDSIAITNSKIIPIGRKYRQQFRDFYFTYKEKENVYFNI